MTPASIHFPQLTRFSLGFTTSAPAKAGLSCRHCRVAPGLAQNTSYLCGKAQDSLTLYPTFPLRPIYPLTTSVEQETHTIKQTVPSVYLTSFYSSHFQCLDPINPSTLSSSQFDSSIMNSKLVKGVCISYLISGIPTI